jgi:hypothetical protein
MRALSMRRLVSATLNAGGLFDAVWNKIRAFFARIEAERRRRRVRLARLLLRVDTARWHDAVSIPLLDRVRLIRRFRRTYRPLYYVNIMMDERLESAALRLTSVSTISYFVLLPFFGLPAASELRYADAFFAATGGTAILFVSVNVCVRALTKFLEANADLRRRLQVIGWAVVVLLAAGVLLSCPQGAASTDTLGQILFLVALGAFGLVIIFFWAAVKVCVLIAIRAWAQGRFPDAYVVRRLFYALSKLEGAGAGWTAIRLRSEVAGDIGSAGILVRQTLFRNFPSRDPATLQWRAQQARRISRLLRKSRDGS